MITDREAFDSTRLGFEIAVIINKLYPGKLDFDKCRFLIANQAVLDALKSNRDTSSIALGAQNAADVFAERRKKYLLY